MSGTATPPDVIEFFLDPASYAHRVDVVQHEQTHVSHLFFAGDYVYKVKKPVDLGFLDFSTLEKRRAAAIAELELNRRLAPEIYLDVAAVHRDTNDHLSFAAPALVEEVAVVMRRLPAEYRLSTLIRSGSASEAMLEELGRRVADFHMRAETSPEISSYGSLETIRHNWTENFEQTETFVGRTLTRQIWQSCKDDIERHLRAYADLFEKRIAAGWIRDCHGDLQTDDIFIDPAAGTAEVLDCIEFNRRFRYSDTIADIAFLSMDLRFRGRDDLAETFLDAYYAASPDERSPSLLHFYECYRAYVRGKVRSFVIDQSGPSATEKAAAEHDARSFFELSLARARRLQPRLILVAGLMGSGKTRQAAELARRAAVRVVHSDVVRKRLAGIDPEEQRHVPFGTGIYSSDWTERTYETLIEEARHEIALGNSIILDASWSQRRLRERARAVAERREALFAVLECTAPEEVLHTRLARPVRSITDGRIELLEDQRAVYEPPSEHEAEILVRVDTAGDFRQASDHAFESLFT